MYDGNPGYMKVMSGVLINRTEACDVLTHYANLMQLRDPNVCIINPLRIFNHAFLYREPIDSYLAISRRGLKLVQVESIKDGIAAHVFGRAWHRRVEIPGLFRSAIANSVEMLFGQAAEEPDMPLEQLVNIETTGWTYVSNLAHSLGLSNPLLLYNPGAIR